MDNQILGWTSENCNYNFVVHGTTIYFSLIQTLLIMVCEVISKQVDMIIVIPRDIFNKAHVLIKHGILKLIFYTLYDYMYMGSDNLNQHVVVFNMHVPLTCYDK